MDEPFAALDEITRDRHAPPAGPAVRAAGDDGAVRHPLDRRGGVHLRPRRRAVGAARAASSASRRSTCPARATPSWRTTRRSSPSRPACGPCSTKAAGPVTTRDGSSLAGRRPAIVVLRRSARGSCSSGVFDVRAVHPPAAVADRRRAGRPARASTSRPRRDGPPRRRRHRSSRSSSPCSLGAVLAASRFLEQAAQPVLVAILVAPWVAYFTSIVVWLGPRRPAGDLPRRLRHDAGVRVRHGRRAALGRPGGPRAAGLRRRQPAGRCSGGCGCRRRCRRSSPRRATTSAWRSPRRTTARAATSPTPGLGAAGRRAANAERRGAVGDDPGHRRCSASSSSACISVHRARRPALARVAAHRARCTARTA